MTSLQVRFVSHQKEMISVRKRICCEQACCEYITCLPVNAGVVMTCRVLVLYGVCHGTAGSAGEECALGLENFWQDLAECDDNRVCINRPGPAGSRRSDRLACAPPVTLSSALFSSSV